ncbi:hypothetical protein B9G98_02658 [Wickerhamiella sorbophila]|uniref:Meiotically up-regulated gene 157 protein n=1 Tax=Wickerhamiella sorbophila TaxID=45607 RepID=A0A2T0FJ68_9ASCO|nr:hypothetical protein B9G98_02658 [Wickerhamiella sorbophila]PRT55038.1 hypothetical protein B9G98_02658 [Wickerhamiella sorbophila]
MVIGLPGISCIIAVISNYFAPVSEYKMSVVGDFDYERFCQERNPPLSHGPLSLPMQRPPPECRTFRSRVIDHEVEQMKAKLRNIPDLARLFENTFPNTLDTTIRFHDSGSSPITFVVTGDINAEWIRDSHRQLSPYTPWASQDKSLRQLLLGAIALHVRYVRRFPHCNAFQPPVEARLPIRNNGQNDNVFPNYDPSFVFECKYELDSLASFFGLPNDYYDATQDKSFMTGQWLETAQFVLDRIQDLRGGTYDEFGRVARPPYMFKRKTDIGTETLPNNGQGNPVKKTGMVRSFFRPSDDTCVYQFLVPANAQFVVELERLSKYAPSELAERAATMASEIREAIYRHGVVNHPDYGDVFAYEVDGYGSSLFMDDANVPSLLSLPILGFVGIDDPLYQNTRRMVLSPANPYFITGPYFEGIGGPHVGLRNAWPMSRILAIRTSNDEEEIAQHLKAVLESTRGLGLIHESINVDTNSFTRPWFSWANAEFAKAIIDLDERRILSKVLSLL